MFGTVDYFFYDCRRIVVLFETKKAADAEYGLWWVSALLYVSYNTVAAVPFFHALGASAGSSRQAAAGGIFGAFFLMTAAFFMNLAILIGTESADNLAIPTLYLARQISPLFGAAFSFVLLIEIFSTAAPMMWTFCSRFAKDGSKKAVAIGLFFIIPAYLFSALPFERLVGCIYPASGVFGFVFLACLIKTFFLRCRRKKSTDGGCREKWGSGCDRKIRMIK